jgi:hypothetical protein
MNRYVRIVVAIVVLVFGSLAAGSGIFGAASDPADAVAGLLVAVLGAAAVFTGVWIGVGGKDADGDPFGDSRSSGHGSYLLIAGVTGLLSLVSLAYFFTGLGDSTRPEQSGGFGFMPIGLAGMVLFGSISVLCTIAWLGARHR